MTIFKLVAKERTWFEKKHTVIFIEGSQSGTLVRRSSAMDGSTCGPPRGRWSPSRTSGRGVKAPRPSLERRALIKVVTGTWWSLNEREEPLWRKTIGSNMKGPWQDGGKKLFQKNQILLRLLHYNFLYICSSTHIFVRNKYMYTLFVSVMDSFAVWIAVRVHFESHLSWVTPHHRHSVCFATMHHLHFKWSAGGSWGRLDSGARVLVSPLNKTRPEQTHGDASVG